MIGKEISLEGVSGLIPDESRPFKHIHSPEIIVPGKEGTAILEDLRKPDFSYIESVYPAGKDIAPGTVLLEAMGEAAGAIIASDPDFDPRYKFGAFRAIDKTRFRLPVLRGDRAIIKVSHGEIINGVYGRAWVRMFLGNRVAVTSILGVSLVLKDSMEEAIRTRENDG